MTVRTRGALSSSIALPHFNPCWTKYNNENTALLDSAASLTLIKTTELGTPRKSKHSPKIITIPNGTTMTTTANVTLNLPQLPVKARTAYLLPGLAHNLLALPQLCDNGCKVTFTRDAVEATLNNKVVLRGWRDGTSNLWRVPIVTNTKQTIEHVANNMLYDCANMEQLTNFYHACCFSPVPDTWINAINSGYFRGWPQLTAQNVR